MQIIGLNIGGALSRLDSQSQQQASQEKTETSSWQNLVIIKGN